MSVYKRDQLCSVRIIYFVITCILLVISIPILIYTFMAGGHRSDDRTLPRYDFLPTIENEPDSESTIGNDLQLGVYHWRRLQDRDERTPVTEVFGLRHVRPALMPDMRHMPKERSCKCPLPFYPVANCTLCYYIPAQTSQNFVRLEQYSKEAATKKCVDELHGEIPSSKLP